MTTKSIHHSNLLRQQAKIQSVSKSPLKSSHKIFLSSNIFLNEYQIKEVQLIKNQTILYEALKNNQKHIIHQVQLNSDDENCLEHIKKIISFIQRPYVEKIFIEKVHQTQLSYKQLDNLSQLEKIHQILNEQEKLKFQIVLNSHFELNQNQNKQQQDFMSTLNQFLSFVNLFHHSKISSENSQDCLVLRNSSDSAYVTHPLDIFNRGNKSHIVSLQSTIKQYVILNIAKNIRQFLNLREKSAQSLLKLFQSKYSSSEFSQFVHLLGEALQKGQKFTLKMLTCYIEIMKQKHLKSKETNQIFKHILNHQSIHQPPQKDFIAASREQKTNSFVNPHDQKSKSMSKKLNLNKENAIDSERFRRSDGLKSSSMISMSPNRKNRKYTKYTTSLFSNSKQSLGRTSSSSFLTKSTNCFNRNSVSSSFIEKNLYKTCIAAHQSNFFKNQSSNENLVPDSQVTNYLKTMGFKSKGNQSRNSKQYLYDQICQKGVKNEEKFDNISWDAKNVTESKLLQQISYARPSLYKQLNETAAQNLIPQKYITQNDQMIQDEKKLRLKKSLGLLQKKNYNDGNYTTQKDIQLQYSQQNIYKQSQSHRDSDKTESISKISEIYDGPMTKTIIHKNKQNDQILIPKFLKFNISKVDDMNIMIKGNEKSKKLKIQRSTVMVMYFLNLDRKIQKEQKARPIQNERKTITKQQDTEESEEVKERRSQRQATFKPSLASVKKEKVIEKNDKIQKSKGQNSMANKPKLERPDSIPSKRQLSSAKIDHDNLQTSYLTKSNTSNVSLQQNTSNFKSLTQVSKQFFKQIFLFINSENKTMVDLLESKLSYEITFYAFYINYFKLNVTKTTTKEAIDKMLTQMKDYETKIKESQKIASDEKMLPEFQPVVKKLLGIDMEAFVQKFWKKQELQTKEKQNFQKISEEADLLTSGILKIAIKIIQSKIVELKCNQKELPLLLKGLKICATISELIYSIENKLLSLSSTKLKKIYQAAAQSSVGYERKWVETITQFQIMIGVYNNWTKQAQTDYNFKVNTKAENKKIWKLLESQ